MGANEKHDAAYHGKTPIEMKCEHAQDGYAHDPHYWPFRGSIGEDDLYRCPGLTAEEEEQYLQDAANRSRRTLDAHIAAADKTYLAGARSTEHLVAHKKKGTRLVLEDATSEQKPELGPVGKWAVGIVSLAIVVPFVGILWAWAAGVVRSLGGLW